MIRDKYMKALILAPFEEKCLSRLRSRLEVVNESWLDTRRLHDPEELAQRLNRENVGILIVEGDFVFEEVFQEAPLLEFVGICRNATSQIDLDAATEKGVVVVNTPGRNANAVAELVIGLILSLARSIPEAHRMASSGSWLDPVSPYIELRGTEVSGKTLGIAGLGTIGSLVAKKARALDMWVIAYDPYKAIDGPESVDVDMVDLEELLKGSDFVSLHIPSAPEVEGIIGAHNLGLMKTSAYLVNTSTASAIDHDALVKVIEKKVIAGAALDVHETSPLPPNNALLHLDNVILTPHIGGATYDTIKRHSTMMTEDVVRFLDGQCPIHILNPSVWRARVQ